jgi:hypothetical protein
MKIGTYLVAFATFCLAGANFGSAQGTFADYQRAHELRAKSQDLVVNTPGAAAWIEDSHRFWYPKSVKGGTEFVLVDADAGTRKPAFDQDRLAAAISSATGHPYTGLKLPFAPMRPRPGVRPVTGATAPLKFLDEDRAIQFGTGGMLYRCSLTDYTCAKTGPIPKHERGRRSSSPDDAQLNPEAGLEGPGGDPVDGLAYLPASALQAGDEDEAGGEPHPCAPSPAKDEMERQNRSSERPGVGSQILGQVPAEPKDVCASFDGKFEAFIQNFNVFIRSVSMARRTITTRWRRLPGRRIRRSWLLITRATVMTAWSITLNLRQRTRFSQSTAPFTTRSRVIPWMLPIRCCSMSLVNRKLRLIAVSFRLLTRSRNRFGGRIAGGSRLNTISGATKCIR